MPPKATFAAMIVFCLGLPAGASAFTAPDVGWRAQPGVILAQADNDKSKEKQGKSEGRKKAEDKEDEPRQVRAKADGDKDEGNKAEGKQQRKTEGKTEDRKKAEDKAGEPKRKEKSADDKKPAKQPEKAKQEKQEKPAEEPRKAEEQKQGKSADEPRKAEEQKQEKPAGQSRQAKEREQPKTEAKEAPRKGKQDAKPGDDRKRAAERPQPDKKGLGSGDDDRERRAGRDGRDGVREGKKTPAKELATKKIEEGKEAVIDGGERVLRREGGKIVIRSDDRDRFGHGERRDERLDDGRTRVVISRPDGSQVITVRGRDGDIVRRVRRMRDGREIVIIDEDEWRRHDDRDRDRGRDRDRDRDGDRDRDHRGDWDRDRDYRGDWDRHRDRDRDFRVELGPLRITIPRERYIVESRGASRWELEEALTAPPVEPVERYYSLEDVRRSDRLRDTMRRIDVSTITFETDSAAISSSQIDALEELGYVLGSIIDRHPDELFLIEGHTDAVGSNIYNLALSDRRAESVAIALSDYFNVPPENLVTQGYGESYLKIPTPYAERENRRVTVRRITPLIRSAEQ